MILTPEIAARYQQDGNSLKRNAKDDPKDMIRVQVSNKDDLEFSPDLTISRWDEVSFKIKPTSLLAGVPTRDKDLSFNGEKIVFSTPHVEFNLYELTTGEGGFEYEIILKEKPATNVISLDIETQGLELFYQPPLTEEPRGDEICTETECRRPDGSIARKRPEKVVGSYVAYHKNPPMNIVGGKEYKTGIAFNIYRPQMIDSVGNKVWGQLYIDEQTGLLTVTIPQAFLDNAVYPIRHAAGLEFGYHTAGGSEDNSEFSQNSYAKASNAPASNGTLTTISTYGRNGGSGRVDAAIYSSDVGDAGPNLLLAGNNLGPTIDNTSSWDDIPVSYALIIAGTQYWLAYQEEWVNYNSGGIFRYRVAGAANWPATADDASDFNQQFSVYATYTPSGTPYTQTCAETLTVTETKTGSATKVSSDSMIFSDNRIFSNFIYKSDSLTVEDYVSPSLLLTQILTELLATSESKMFSISSIRSETPTFLDSTIKAFTTTKADSVALSDSQFKLPSLIKAETLASADSQYKSISLGKVEVITLSDALTKIANIIKSENATFADYLETEYTAGGPTYSQALVEFIYFTLPIVGLTEKTLAETLSFLESLRYAISIVKAENIVIPDYSIKGVTFPRSDTFSISDSQYKTPIKVPIETITFGETTRKDNIKYMSDTLTLLDNMMKTYSTTKADSFTLSDSVDAQLVSYTIKVLAETFSIAESIRKSLGVNKAESLGVTESTRKNIAQIYVDILAINDTLRKTTGLIKSETLQIQESKAITILKQMVETLQLLDSLTAILTELPEAIELTLTEQIAIADAFRRIVNLGNKFVNVFTSIITDDISDHFDVNRIITDDISGRFGSEFG